MKTNLDQIKAGADIHAGDGGYSLGTQEAHDEFVKNRNRSLAKARLRELIKQATHVEEPDGLFLREVFDQAKFAELIVRECADRIRFCIKNDIDFIAEDIEKHFGVEE